MTPSPAPIRVLVLEDHSGTREALAALVGGTPGFALAGQHATAEAALRHVPLQRPDVALVDLDLAGTGGTEFLRTCRLRFPGVQLLVLTIHGEPEWVFPALEAGASGYLVKGTPPARILEAIAEVRDGGSSMSGPVARLVLNRLHREPAVRSVQLLLSPRELEVLEALARGLHYAGIGQHLGISERTVSTHLHRIYAKLHVHSAAGAVGTLLDRGAAPNPDTPRSTRQRED